MGELFDWNTLPELFHAPQNIPGSPVRRHTSSKGVTAYLRSLVGTPVPFKSRPDIPQKASQLSTETFASEPRPIAFRKALGVTIWPARWLSRLDVARWIRIPIFSGTYRNAAALCIDLSSLRGTIRSEHLSVSIEMDAFLQIANNQNGCLHISDYVKSVAEKFVSRSQI